jgi:hypothetical protein
MAAKTPKRRYTLDGKSFVSFDAAASKSVAMALFAHETTCIRAVVAGKVVERIDVTAALSIDDPDRE